MLHVPNISMPFTANNNSKVNPSANTNLPENKDPLDVMIINATLPQFTQHLHELSRKDPRIAKEILSELNPDASSILDVNNITDDVVRRLFPGNFDQDGKLTPSAQQCCVSNLISEELPETATFRDLYRLYLQSNGVVGNNLNIKG